MNLMKKILFASVVVLFVCCSCKQHNITTQSSSYKDSVTVLSDSALLDLVQKQTIQYFTEGAEPVSGMARERININNVYPDNDYNVITTGGSGFGIMDLLIGAKRGFIAKDDLIRQLTTIVSFLEKADKYHGAFSHWYFGETGKTKPFGQKDDGGDIVETSFLFQGLLCARQYLIQDDVNEQEINLAKRIDSLWKGVDYNWYTKGENVLYWHWSPDYDWQMNFPIHGFNECLIAYILAASSPQHSVSKDVYINGWCSNGAIKHAASYKNIPLQFLQQGNQVNGGALFWTQYSFLGLNPVGLKDAYGSYEQETKNMSLINYQWCVDNPKHFAGYGDSCWGLTASYSVDGYHAHAPNMNDDIGVISPTAALSSFVYTPQQSMQALHYFYERLGNNIWGKYGFYDAFSRSANWYPQEYLAIDQGPAPAMIENYRSRFLWKLFMSCPEVQQGLDKLGFTYTIPQ